MAKRGEARAFLDAVVADPPEGCVEWPFSMFGGTGYGAIWFEGKMMTAHRVALILASGKNPVDLVAAHGSCHNRPCVNPHHVEWSTQSKNVGEDRLRDGTSNRGERHPQSKLGEHEVIEVRERHARGETMTSIAGQFGVSRVTVSDIINGHTWGWL
jgi:hypothetical protein